MTIDQFMEGIGQNAARVKEYRLGMDGRNGQCDCIGLIIGAIRLMGGEWKGTHGSNWAARNEMASLGPILSADSLSVGDMVFKAHIPGETGYSLPDAYRNHEDKKDYYHVGVVESLSPLSIVHCTSVAGGIKRDSSLGKWSYNGQWKGIESSLPPVPYEPYTVIGGGSLNLRRSPYLTAAVLERIPEGKMVTARAVDGKPDWLQVRYNGLTGYCMAQYLMKEGAMEPEKEPADGLVMVAVEMDRQSAKALQGALNKALEGR